MFYLTIHSADVRSYIARLRTTRKTKTETCCHQSVGYIFRLAARDILYTQSHRQDKTTAFVA